MKSLKESLICESKSGSRKKIVEYTSELQNVLSLKCNSKENLRMALYENGSDWYSRFLYIIFDSVTRKVIDLGVVNSGLQYPGFVKSSPNKIRTTYSRAHAVYDNRTLLIGNKDNDPDFWNVYLDCRERDENGKKIKSEKNDELDYTKNHKPMYEW